MIRAILFDFDGVVVQSEPLHLRSFRELLKPLRVRIPTERWYREFTGIGSTAITTALFRDFRIQEDVKAWVEKRKAYYQRLVLQGKLKTIPGVRSFLRMLKKKGIPTAIVSGGHGTNIKLVLEKLKLTVFFDSIVALEDVQNRKPHPEGFLLAAQRLGAKPEECIAIEDSPNGISAAHAAGMKVVCVRSPAQVDQSKCNEVIADFRSFPRSLVSSSSP
jgi:beta-phosphoglucomutase family hydrolase